MKRLASKRPLPSHITRRSRHRPESRGAPGPPPHGPQRAWLETALYGVLMAGLVLAFCPSLQIQFTLPKLVVLRGIVPLLIVIWIFRWRNHETRRLPAVVLIAA